MGRPPRPRPLSEPLSDKHGSYRLIELTKGQFAKVDEADAAAINVRRWCAQWDAKTESFYAACRLRLGHRKYRTTSMHRHLMGELPFDIKVDHADHDTLNNRRYNLRKVDDLQSAWNRRTRIDNTSQHKGVTWNSRDRLWYARLQSGEGSSRRHIGCFKSKEEAIHAYRSAAVKQHGEFGCLEGSIGEEIERR